MSNYNIATSSIINRRGQLFRESESKKLLAISLDPIDRPAPPLKKRIVQGERGSQGSSRSPNGPSMQF